jgi:membrane protease YdiL (CAAX protease family)
VPVTPATAALTFVALAVLVAGGWSWLLAAVRAALTWGCVPQSLVGRVETALRSAGIPPRLPLVPWSTRRLAPWTFFDLCGLIGIYVVALVVIHTFLRQIGWLPRAEEIEEFSLDQRKVLIAGNVAVSLAIAGIGLPLIALRTGATLRDFGWSWREIAADLRLGLIGFVMLAPPVYALQGALVHFWRPSKHPLIEMFKGTPDTAFFVFLFVSAAVVAPLFEELIFRVVLQGFLEKAFGFRGEPHELLLGGAPGNAQEAASNAVDGQMALADSNPYASPVALTMAANPLPLAGSHSQQPELRGWLAWLPIAVSSAVFALLHYSHGPDWIPLLFLAAGMGYLYQRTHRLLPSLVVHASLNTLSMCGLWVQVQEGKF